MTVHLDNSLEKGSALVPLGDKAAYNDSPFRQLLREGFRLLPLSTVVLSIIIGMGTAPSIIDVWGYSYGGGGGKGGEGGGEGGGEKAYVH